MNDERVGRTIRAVRVALGLRQTDVAELAEVDQTMVSLLERGKLVEVSARTFRGVCAALGITIDIELRWRGGALDRLIDRGHASIIEAVLSELRAAGWTTVPEFTFNHFGERGSVDILAWHPLLRALLIIEVKTALTDVQAMLMSVSRKVRIVPELARKEHGWERTALGRILVLAGSRANRSTVERHAAMFDATFPARTVDARRWLSRPEGDFAAVWFVALRHMAPVPTTAVGRVRRVPPPGTTRPGEGQKPRA